MHMEKRYIEDVVRDQKEDFEILLKTEYATRYEENLVDLNSPLAQVVIGVRRSGKSTLCINVIKKSKLNFAYVNFDDERLKNIQSNDLNVILECLYQIYGSFNHLFLDEIQNVDAWPLFVNRLLRRGMRIIITGSNAKLLSGELATHLTGRHNQVSLYPFSFLEFCYIKNKDISYSTTKERGLLRSSFDEYLRSGGFPEIITTSVNAKIYINTLVNNILTNDIVNRYKIRYKAEFEKLAKHILNIVPSKINAKELQEIFSFGSSHTVENYISYIENAYLISTISKFSYKSKQRVTNYKAYAIDISLMNSRQNTLRGDNLGWRLETIVYIELLRRYKNMNYDIYYYAEQSYEVDFVICENNMVMQLIQVSYDISSPTTFKREVKALSKAGAKLKCNNMLLLSLYTDFPSNSANENNIKVQDVVSWLISFKQDFGKDDKAEPYSK